MLTHRAARLTVLLLGAVVLGGCLSSSAFTTARSVGDGEIVHGPSLEIALPHTRQSRDIDYPAAVPGYSLHYGVSRRFELFGKLSPFSAQAGAKLVLLDDSDVALALLPRYTTGGWHIGRPPHMIDAPLLITVQPTSWLSVTPRFGVAGVFGDAGMSWPGTPPYHPEGMMLQLGLTSHFSLSRRITLVFDAASLHSLDSSSQIIPSFGLGLMFGRSPASPPAQ